MSYVALITDAYEAMVAFYADDLGARTLARWDRPTGRGRRFDLRGLRLEILDNRRQRHPVALRPPDGRAHLVIEVADLAAERAALRLATPEPTATSWGATLFELRDPDGTAVTFLQWPRP